MPAIIVDLSRNRRGRAMLMVMAGRRIRYVMAVLFKKRIKNFTTGLKGGDQRYRQPYRHARGQEAGPVTTARNDLQQSVVIHR